MLARWTKILPVFVYQWLARRHCQRSPVDGVDYARAAEDILVRDEKDWRRYRTNVVADHITKYGYADALNFFRGMGYPPDVMLAGLIRASQWGTPSPAPRAGGPSPP